MNLIFIPVGSSFFRIFASNIFSNLNGFKFDFSKLSGEGLTDVLSQEPSLGAFGLNLRFGRHLQFLDYVPLGEIYSRESGIRISQPINNGANEGKFSFGFDLLRRLHVWLPVPLNIVSLALHSL